jgi:SAM-dependent methyltransferase
MIKLKALLRSIYTGENRYTAMQKIQYKKGTSDHLEHNSNKDYWEILLGEINEDPANFNQKKALDFACGKGRNIENLWKINPNFHAVDGCDISAANISHCIDRFVDKNGSFVTTSGTNIYPLEDSTYDFVMSTIALQHIPVHEIRFSLLKDIFRVMKSGGLFSFQMGCGSELVDTTGGVLSGYFENNYDANGTNSIHDVQVVDPNDVIGDLRKIGFTDISYLIRPSYSDIRHENWIYFKGYKNVS